MLDEKEGGPAFPVPENVCINSGMTLRDWFAGQALAGICADPVTDGGTWKAIATMAYLAADTMLQIRSETNGK